MKKTLIASAVAAATISTSAFAMDPVNELKHMMESMPTISGNIQLAHISSETEVGSATSNSSELIDNGSTLRFTHDSALSEDSTAFFKAEFHFDADDKGEDSLGETLDEAFIGMKGEFGSIQAGTDDTVYEWVDRVDNVEAVGVYGDIAGVNEGDNLQYVSPELADGLKVGVTVKTDSDTTDAGALAAKYSSDGVTLVAAYALGRDDGSAGKGDTFGLNGSVDIDDITLLAQFESQDDSTVNNVEMTDATTFWAIQAKYGMGATNLSLAYGLETQDTGTSSDVETSSIGFQALHNCSDNMYVYVEGLFATAESSVAGSTDVDTTEIALGATYHF